MDAYFSSDRALMELIGKMIRKRRIGAQMTQKQLAEQASVAISSVANIEKGENSSLLTIIQVLRTLRSLDLLEAFLREEEVSPIAYAEAMSKKRVVQRVRNAATKTIKPESQW